jgi:iron complex outermembrane receptor protein
MPVSVRPSPAQLRPSRPFAFHPFRRRWLPAHAALLGVLALPLHAAAAESAEDAGQAPAEAAPLVITSVAPKSPLTVETNPKQPRQPVPASDGTDYLKTIPGFAAIRNGGVNGDPVFRGMFGSRIKLLTNGGEMIGACPGRMDAPSSYISPESYDRLTVIKGPQSVRWGAGASAATVLFEREPEHFAKPDWRLNASLLIGSYGRFDRSLDAAAGNQDGYARLLANRSSADDYSDGDGHSVPSRFDKWNGDLVLGWTPDANTLLELTAGTGDGEARYAGRSMDGTQFRRESFGLRFKKSYIGEVFHGIEAQLYYNYADHVMDNFTLRSPDPKSMMPMPMASNVDRRTLGGRVAGTWRWDRVELVAGVDGQTSEHRRRASTYNMMSGVYTDADQYGWSKDAEMDNVGVFGEATVKFDRRQRLVSGARVDRASAKDFRQTITNPKKESWANPSADDTRSKTLYSGFTRYERDLASLPATFYVGLGHSERFPDYWELFSASAGPKGSVQAFSTVNPEKTTQLDVGMQYHGRAVDAWFSAYAGVVDDYILFDYVPMGSMTRTMVGNVDARIAGAELGASYRFARHWKGDASLAYAWGENTTDHSALPQMPPLEARLGLTYERDNWSTSALWRVVAAQTRIAEGQGNVVGKDFGQSSGFGVFSFNGAYRVSKHLKLSAGLDNLFDKRYSEHLNRAGDAGFGFSADTRVNEPGRTAWTRLDLSF